jgi:hypothetical protein
VGAAAAHKSSAGLADTGVAQSQHTKSRSSLSSADRALKSVWATCCRCKKKVQLLETCGAAATPFERLSAMPVNWTGNSVICESELRVGGPPSSRHASRMD